MSCFKLQYKEFLTVHLQYLLGSPRDPRSTLGPSQEDVMY